MTKKYWKDWQSKKDKTHQVEYWNDFLDTYRYSKWAINIINGDKIVDIQFHGEAVDITIERYDIEFNNVTYEYETRYVNTEIITLHRNDVKSVYFF